MQAVGLRKSAAMRGPSGSARSLIRPVRRRWNQRARSTRRMIYAQTHYILARTAEFLAEVGAQMCHVARVRVYLTDMSHSAGFIKAHGEVFAGINPVLTAVTAGLTQPGLVVEIDVDAVIHDLSGKIIDS